MPPLTRAVVVSAALTSMAGCAGWDIERNRYVAPKLPLKRARVEASYGFGSPGGEWRPLRDAVGGDVQVVWIQPELVGVIALHVQCEEHGDSSLEQYTDHLRIDWTDWEVLEQKQTRLAGRAALRTVVNGQLDGMRRRSEMWVVKKNGCLFDLIYSSRPADFSAGQGDFQRVVDGFAFPLGS